MEADGEAYRATLVARVKALKLGGHVRFVDEFAHRVAMTRWLQAADIVVTPYPDLDQTVSGTLSYAMGAGRAIVSTPYAYAAELLAGGRGILVPEPSPGPLAAVTQQGARGRQAPSRPRPEGLRPQPQHGLVGGRSAVSRAVSARRGRGLGRRTRRASGARDTERLTRSASSPATADDVRRRCRHGNGGRHPERRARIASTNSRQGSVSTSCRSGRTSRRAVCSFTRRSAGWISPHDRSRAPRNTSCP